MPIILGLIKSVYTLGIQGGCRAAGSSIHLPPTLQQSCTKPQSNQLKTLAEHEREHMFVSVYAGESVGTCESVARALLEEQPLLPLSSPEILAVQIWAWKHFEEFKISCLGRSLQSPHLGAQTCLSALLPAQGHAPWCRQEPGSGDCAMQYLLRCNRILPKVKFLINE